LYTQSESKKIPFAPERRQAPPGKHRARIAHVEPNWSFFGGRKVALYFEITEGPHKGATARKFYRLTRTADGEYLIAPGSKLASDAQRLFSDRIEDDGLDPVHVFQGRFVDVVTEQRTSKRGTLQSIVTDMEHPDVGF
jgi:hypothetical protein